MVWTWLYLGLCGEEKKGVRHSFMELTADEEHRKKRVCAWRPEEMVSPWCVGRLKEREGGGKKELTVEH